MNLHEATLKKNTDRKIFRIGRNKTGTTSLEHALTGLGLSTGYQPRGEMLLKDWHQRHYGRISQLVEATDELRKFNYRYPGYLRDSARVVYGATEETVYGKNYLDHNEAVLQLFDGRSADLLVLNVSDPNAMRSLCEFLSIEWTGQTMPHSNKT
jgi:hypothetical protein